jgi:Spy/CpxP family protein refolding chaperone
MTRSTAVFLSCTLVASVAPPAFAQSPATHQAGIKAAVGSLNLTAAQKASVKEALKAHKGDLKAARASGDKAATLQARRAALRDVLQVLTPSQREQVQARVKHKLTQP